MSNINEEFEYFNEKDFSYKEFLNSQKLLADVNVLTVPKRSVRLLSTKKIEKRLLEISSDKLLAVEYCLVFLSNLVHVQFTGNNEKWKSLSSKVLREQIPGSEGTYKKVIEFLLEPIFSFSPLIEVKLNNRETETYEVGTRSKQYRLSNLFLNNKVEVYKISNSYHKKRRLDIYRAKIIESKNNLIVSNLLAIYPKLTLPVENEILVEAKRLVKIKYRNGKGKKLTILNGRKKTDLVDQKRIYLEDSLKLFKYLTENGFKYPSISGERSGGRVYDSINMMPRFIRSLIKIDNEETIDVDFRCLHPNLAVKLYGGTTRYITHELIKDKLEMELYIVKEEHLSFFNKKTQQMRQSVLYSYYETNEPTMLKNIISDKNKNSYKITSQKMFDLEVKIMTECIRRLNKIGIDVLYVFDALLVKCSNQKAVENTMNQVVSEMGIYTNIG
ncbi:hypothetical protein Flavo103_11020 [Flavobacterium collinsii]|uniref:hypothetical protein n=1 Tax=Flavobacterium collinsii TaxID=1114861 RepID=UPI0022BC5B2C|nr:hypothetical protein [Flavobacterium collinsii]GIQ57966.1 hypothetical protein Flavo103_11020 [Flavobacterium collinsii]